MTMSQPKFTLVTQTVLADDSICGLRNIDSFGSILQVRAAPFADLDRLMTTASRLTFVSYVIDAPKIYTGHGKGSRKIGERLNPQELKQAQVYILYSFDPRFDKPAASYLEARLIDVAYELGVPLANNTRPFGRDGLWICPNLEQMVVHAQFLLAIAGFRRFEDAKQTTTDRPARVMATADLHDVRIISPETMAAIPTGVVLKRLVHKVLKGEGYELGDRFVVLPGAGYCYETKSGLSDDNRARREALQQLDIFEELPGVTGRVRLRVGLDCKSAPIAAKILTGEHVGNNAWQPAPLTAPGEARAA